MDGSFIDRFINETIDRSGDYGKDKFVRFVRSS
jgi:hypothetical protein